MQHHLVGPAATLPLLGRLWPAHGDAAEHAVTAPAVQWVPAALFIEPGDTVVWHGMAGHETALLDRMAPAGIVGAVIVESGKPHSLATIEAAIADGKLGGATLRPPVARSRRELRQQGGP